MSPFASGDIAIIHPLRVRRQPISRAAKSPGLSSFDAARTTRTEETTALSERTGDDNERPVATRAKCAQPRDPISHPDVTMRNSSPSSRNRFRSRLQSGEINKPACRAVSRLHLTLAAPLVSVSQPGLLQPSTDRDRWNGRWSKLFQTSLRGHCFSDSFLIAFSSGKNLGFRPVETSFIPHSVTRARDWLGDAARGVEIQEEEEIHSSFIYT